MPWVEVFILSRIQLSIIIINISIIIVKISRKIIIIVSLLKELLLLFL